MAKRTAARKTASKKRAPKKAAAKKPAARKAATKKPAAAKKPSSRAVANKSNPRATNRTSSRSATAPRQAAPRTATRSRAAAANPTAAVRPAARPNGAVDGYVARLNDWRRDCVAGLRKMIKQAVPKSSENVKGSQPVYEHHGPFAWIKAHARHVKLGFRRGVELPDPRKLLKGSGTKVRHIKLRKLTDATKKELRELVRLAAELNEIKGSPSRPAKPRAKK
jgi:hypothetical protein